MPIQPRTTIEQYVLDVLNQQGFSVLDETSQQEMFPQFMAEAEQRLGARLLPLLDKSAAQDFDKLLKQQEVKPEELWNFWQKHVPNFLEVVKGALNDYAKEVAVAFGNK
ncbi:MAG: DUF5663 domain-containing protein [Candidatus Magasanikbacteria bacterium]